MFCLFKYLFESYFAFHFQILIFVQQKIMILIFEQQTGTGV